MSAVRVGADAEEGSVAAGEGEEASVTLRTVVDVLRRTGGANSGRGSSSADGSGDGDDSSELSSSRLAAAAAAAAPPAPVPQDAPRHFLYCAFHVAGGADELWRRAFGDEAVLTVDVGKLAAMASPMPAPIF